MRPYSVEIRLFDDVKRLWASVRSVPGRTGGRKHYHEEQYCLGLYLLALGTYELLAYPFQVAQAKPQQESPDFLLKWSSGQITALEVKMATEESFQYVMTAATRMYDRRKAGAPVCSLMFSGPFPTSKPLTSRAILRSASNMPVGTR